MLAAGAAVVLVTLVFLFPRERLSQGYDWFQVWRFQKEYLRSSILEQGTIPLWCRWSFSGLPFLANPQTGIFYPFTLLYVIFPAGLALPIDALLHYALAGAGMILFCRARGLGGWGSLVGAIALLGCGFNIAHTTVGHIHSFAAVAWLPFVFLAVERWVTGRSPAWIAAGGGAVALQLFGGAIPICWMTLVFSGLYGAGRVAEIWIEERGPAAGAAPGAVNRRRAMARLAGVVAIPLLGFTLAACQLLPTWELTSLSLREGAGYDYAVKDALPADQTPGLVSPARLEKGTAWEYYGYDGVAVLALAGAAVVAGLRRRSRWLFVGLAAFALLMMLGDATPAFRLFYYTVPGLSMFRAHAREVLALSFCLAFLAAAAVDAVVTGEEVVRIRLRRALAAAAVVTGVCALGLTLAAAGAEGAGAGEGAAAGGPAVVFWMVTAAGSLIAAAGLDSRRRWSPALLGVLLIADLIAAERVVRDLITIPPVIPSQQEGLARTLAADEGNYRFWFTRVHFLSNEGYALHRSAIEGYDNNFLKRYRTYVHAMTGAPVKPDVILILTQLNFRYAPTPFPFAILNVKYAEKQNEDGTWQMHTNPDPCGPAFLPGRVEIVTEEEMLARMRQPGFDPREVALLEEPPPGGPFEEEPDGEPPGPAGEVSVVGMTPNRIRLAAEARRETILVLSEIHYPGWKVLVDGEPRPLIRADYLLRAVRVEKGRHEVEFVFSPPSLHRGLTITSLGLVACIGLIGASWSARRRKGTS